jgi:hypothetical protein
MERVDELLKVTKVTFVLAWRCRGRGFGLLMERIGGK